MATISFKDSQEAALRRFIRSIIKTAPDLTKTDRLVTLAVMNHFFHHKSKKEPIHPGRKKIAKAANCSIRMVASTFAKLRAAGVLIDDGYLKGGYGRATRYHVNTRALIVLCGCDLPDELALSSSWFCTVDSAKFARLNSAGFAHGISNVRGDQAKDADGQGEVPF